MELKRALTKRLRRKQQPESIELPKPKLEVHSTPETPLFPSTPMSESFASLSFDEIEQSPKSQPSSKPPLHRATRSFLGSRSRSVSSASSVNPQMFSTASSPNGSVSDNSGALSRRSSIQRSISLSKSPSFSKKSTQMPLSPVSISDAQSFALSDGLVPSEYFSPPPPPSESVEESNEDEDEDERNNALADEMAQRILETVKSGGHFWAL